VIYTVRYNLETQKRMRAWTVWLTTRRNYTMTAKQNEAFFHMAVAAEGRTHSINSCCII
jgi:hypothetical protein